MYKFKTLRYFKDLQGPCCAVSTIWRAQQSTEGVQAPNLDVAAIFPRAEDFGALDAQAVWNGKLQVLGLPKGAEKSSSIQ